MADALISFPKSGRTWLHLMLIEIGADLDCQHFAGQGAGRTFQDLSADASTRYNRIIFLHRDPCDTVVSSYHQIVGRRKTFSGTMSEFIRSPGHGIEKIARYNLMWISHLRERGASHILSYESLHSNGIEELGSVASFLGLSFDQPTLGKIYSDHSFGNMQAREHSGAYREQFGRILTPADPDDLNTYKVRRGVVGGYAEEMSTADVEYCRAALNRLEYSRAITNLLL